MKAIFDKYKYILGLGLALIAVIIVAIVSAVAGKDTAENSGISYVTPETSSFTTAESLIATTPKTTVNSQSPPVTTVTDTSSQTTASQTTSQTTASNQKAEMTATTAYAATVPATIAETSKATEKPITVTSTAKATTTVKSTTKATSKATTPKPADKPTKKYDNTCTFTIDCKTILNNKDKLKKGLEKYVPDNGMIYSGTVGFDSVESVYDILRRICDENSIQMEASYTTMFSSYYVEGINNLYEFDCGQGSGWMYSVNGVFPNYGCSSYKPVNNDKIAFRYTCERGYDL